MGKLPWQRAVVVGASSGIGAALARELAGAGCHLALVARREPELRRLRDEIDPGGDRVNVYPHDVRRPEEAPRTLDAIAHHLDGLDLVVYSAGIMPRIGPDEAARRILRAAARGSGVAYVPAAWRPLMFVVRNIPGWLFQRLDI